MEKTAKGGSRRPTMRSARAARAPVSTLPAVDIAEATATESGGVDTFSDDLTPAQLSARPLQPGPPRKASSQNQYDKTGNKHWNLSCKAAGWEAEKKLNFLDDEYKPCDGTFRQLFVWLYEQKVSTHRFSSVPNFRLALTKPYLALPYTLTGRLQHISMRPLPGSHRGHLGGFLVLCVRRRVSWASTRL